MTQTVTEEYDLGVKNGNTLCKYAITKDMKDTSPDFGNLDNGDIVRIGYQRLNCRMIFMLICNIYGARICW